MIEIAFDKHLDPFFKEQEHPLLDVPDLCNKPFDAYISYAQKAIKQYRSQKYLIAISDDSHFDTNLLSLAFFIASCLDNQNTVDCLVIKNENYKKAFENYKPYIAISIGIKYALRLIKEPADVIYKELKCLNYLNFSIKEDCVQNTICYTFNSQNTSYITTNNTFEALVYASLYKILALAEIEIPFNLNIRITSDTRDIDAKEIISTILEKVSPYINI